MQYNQLYLWRICLIAALGGLLFGYDYVVIGGAKPFYEAHFGINDIPRLQGFIMSIAMFGCLFGALFSGMFADRFGRKRLLILSAILFVCTSIGNALATSLWTFGLFRLFGGVGIGLASGLSPIYIAEVSPKTVRGRFVSLNQLTIMIGMLLAMIINYMIARGVPAGITPEEIVRGWYGMYGWRWMIAAVAVPATFFFLCMLTVPESPRWLIKQKQSDRARSVLTGIGGAEYAQEEIEEIERTLLEERETRSDFREITRPALRPILALGIFLAVFQQWCGFNVVMNYAEEVFRSAGYDISGMMSNIVMTGVVNLLFTFIAIATVDRFGRRPLMLIGAGGLALFYGLLGLGYYVQLAGPLMLGLILLASGCFSMTLGPMVWVVLSEIFPNRIRGAAMSVAVASLWIANIILTYTFPILNSTLGSYGTFWIYAVICAGSFLVVYRTLPETKGKSLEEIEAELLAGKPKTNHLKIER